jgi:hypothetical protein
MHSLLLLLQLHFIATTTAMLAVVRAVCTLVSACAVQLLLQLLLVLLTVMLPTALTYTVYACLRTLRAPPYCNGAQQPCSFATACDNSGGIGKQLVTSLIVQCTADQVRDPTALLTIHNHD